MSVSAVVELALHIDSFRNVDLVHQGCYRVGIQIIQPNKANARTKEIRTKNEITSGERIESLETHQLEPSYLDNNEYATRTFFIKFWDEEVKINDVVIFSAELSLDWIKEKLPFKIITKLYFGDWRGNVLEIPENMEYISYVENLYILNSPSSPSSELLQVIFDENFSGVMNLAIHTWLLEYKFDPQGQKVPLELVVAHWLFKNKKGQMKAHVGSEETNQLYKKLAGALIQSYEYFGNYFTHLTNNLMTPAKRDELNGGSRTPPLTLPGTPAQMPYAVVNRTTNGQAGPIVPENAVTKFSERISSHDPLKLASMIMNDTKMLGTQVKNLWTRVLNAILQWPRQVQEYHLIISAKREIDYNCKSIVSKTTIVNKFDLEQPTDLLETHEGLIRTLLQSKLPEKRIQLQQSIDRLSCHSILIEDIYATRHQEIMDQNISNSHLVVLVHGYQGNSFDMRIFKSCLSVTFPRTIFLSSMCNEMDTDDDIWKMGQNLADEIKGFLNDWCNGQIPSKISFVGHSLGGIIIRAALPHLLKMKDQFHFYMSLGSPHLGYMRKGSKIIDAGMWLIKQMSRTQSLQQLTFEDSKDIRASALFDLSRAPGLEYFAHIFLVCSQQDQYVHFDSARMELGSMVQESKNYQIFQEMTSNILDRLTKTQLHKINVRYSIGETSVDSIIGRSAHMMYLENASFMNTFKYKYYELFT